MSAQISSNNGVKMHHASKDANNKEPIFSEYLFDKFEIYFM